MHRATRQASHTILLVEASPTLRRMITLGLQYRGLRIIEVDAPGDLPDLSTSYPDLILLDIDGAVGNGAQSLAEIESNPLLASLPIVTLAWETPGFISSDEEGVRTRHSRRISLVKPFDARALYAVIESQLHRQLSSVEEQYVRSASRAITRVAYAPSTAPPAPSLCPMLTAVGLLLAFIGLMLQLAITAIGLLIVIIALLWWTLGTKPGNVAMAR